MSFFTMRWSDDGVLLLDQRALPDQAPVLCLRNAEEVARAIEDMVVRGAPAIGVTAAMGVAIELANANDADVPAALERAVKRLAATRPTAVNLTWALERVQSELSQALRAGTSPSQVREQAKQLAQQMHDEDVQVCQAIGDAGGPLLPDAARVLTHCNAGALATAGYGTALGVIRSAARDGRLKHVLASETRPFLQGARLTAWELQQDAIPVQLVTDSMCGALMRQGEIDAVVVGADRIAANGDVANKIGTYSLAVLAERHGIPFYVAAPLSTVDLRTPNGDSIPIEQRSSDEVVKLRGQRIAPEGVQARHPAFDVTPAELITAIITEKGVARAPFEQALAAQFER